jgi:hypothetical protein
VKHADNRGSGRTPGRPAEGEAVLVVAEVTVSVTIKTRPVEEGGVLHEDDSQTRAQLPFVETGTALEMVDGHVHGPDEPARGEFDRAVTGHETQHLVAPRGEGLGQGRRHVGQAARFRERRHLRRRVDDPHEGNLSEASHFEPVKGSATVPRSFTLPGDNA